MNLPNTRAAGFTLIELMIVVLIIGIISAIAYPSYVEYVKRGNRAEGRAAIAAAAQQLERCMTRFNSYNHGDCVVTEGDTETGKYTLSVTYEPEAEGTANEYTITAEQHFGDTTCGDLTLQHNGIKTPNNDECW